MIDWLDLTLRDLLVDRVGFLDAGPPGGLVPEQVGFQPPDREWVKVVDSFAPRRALDLYLVDVRENRVLRTNESERELRDGVVLEHPAPHRLDCHYLVSAWSPATEADGKTIDEHRLLAEAAAVLLEHRPLVPAEVYGPAGLPAGYPAALADAELPVVLAPPAGFAKVPEFWGSFERHQPWRPTLWLTVTIPVVVDPRVAGPPVTTLYGHYRQDGDATTEETLMDVGGLVLDGGGTPVGGAWVRLETAAGDVLQTATTDGRGRFVFVRLAAESYVFRAGASGVGGDHRTIPVPSLDGSYDLQLT